jgi:hypothetical protein
MLRYSRLVRGARPRISQGPIRAVRPPPRKVPAQTVRTAGTHEKAGFTLAPPIRRPRRTGRRGWLPWASRPWHAP